MARQAMVPGQGYANETGTLQAMVPGFGFADESSTNIYNDSLNFNATANDSLAVATAFTETISESATSAFSQALVTAFNNAINESLTSADSLSLAAIFVAAFTEAATSASTFSLGTVYNDAINESSAAGYAYNPVPVNRQAMVPGQGFMNENGTRQAMVPGKGYANETSPYRYNGGAYVVFNNPITENLTSSDSLTLFTAFNLAFNEVVFVYDVPQPLPSFTSVYGRAIYALTEYASGGFSVIPQFAGGSYPAVYGLGIYSLIEYAAAGYINSAQIIPVPYINVRYNLSMLEHILAEFKIAIHGDNNFPTDRLLNLRRNKRVISPPQ